MTTTSVDLLTKSLKAWSAIAGRKLNDEAQETWMKLFQHVPPEILLPALEMVTMKTRRMPWPGDLSEAIAIVRERSCTPPVDSTAHTEFPGVDPETGKPIVLWRFKSDGHIGYDIKDCPEGRELLAFLRGELANPYPSYKPCTVHADKLHKFDRLGKGGKCLCGFEIPFDPKPPAKITD